MALTCACCDCEVVLRRPGHREVGSLVEGAAGQGQAPRPGVPSSVSTEVSYMPLGLNVTSCGIGRGRSGRDIEMLS